MEIVVVVRKTLDWRNLTEFSHKGFNYGWDNFLKNVDRWNENFNLSYFEYRQSLKEIALESLKKTKIPIFVGDVKLFFKNNKHNKNLFVIPIDDDDWLHPNIKYYLKYGDIVRWQNWIYNIIYYKEIIKPFDGFGNSNVFGSNEYMVNLSKSALPFLLNHGALTNQNSIKVNECLSVWVRHPGSYLHLSENEKCLINPKCNYSSIPNQLEWATPYIENVRKINLKYKSSNLKMF